MHKRIQTNTHAPSEKRMQRMECREKERAREKNAKPIQSKTSLQLNYEKIDSTNRNIQIHGFDGLCVCGCGCELVKKAPQRVNPIECARDVHMSFFVAFIDTSCIWRARKLKNINLLNGENGFLLFNTAPPTISIQSTTFTRTCIHTKINTYEFMSTFIRLLYYFFHWKRKKTGWWSISLV